MKSLLIKKVFREILQNKARTMLVVLTISIGVFGTGTITQSKYVMTESINQLYEMGHPSSGTIITDGFDPNVLYQIKNRSDVSQVEGRTSITLKVSPDQKNNIVDNWKRYNIHALRDYTNLSLDTIYFNKGSKPPARNEIVFEKSSLDLLDLEIGDSVVLTTADDKHIPLTISGTVIDPIPEAATISGIGTAYIAWETLETLGVEQKLNSISFLVAEHRTDKNHIYQVASLIREQLKKQDIHIENTIIPEPGKHWAYDIIKSMVVILETMGIITVLLSLSLVINTILFIITSQVRQIGVMKVLGGTNPVLTKPYILTIFFYGCLALLISIPLSLLGTKIITYSSRFAFNIDRFHFGLSPTFISLVLILGIVLPIIISFFPIHRSLKITVREAIQDNGIGQQKGSDWITTSLIHIRILPLMLILSLRNTFRKKGRLFVTILTYSLAGAMVISIFSLHASMRLTESNTFNYTKYDMQLFFEYAVPKTKAEMIAQTNTYVKRVEGWGMYSAYRIRDDGTKSGEMIIYAPPPNTNYIEPTILPGGSWIHNHSNGIVFDSYLLNEETDVKVGKQLKMEINGVQHIFPVAGISMKIAGKPFSYISYPMFHGKIEKNNTINVLNIMTDEMNRQELGSLAEELKRLFNKRGMPVKSVEVTEDVNSTISNKFKIMLLFLLIFNIQYTIIGALSLMGTMSLNVMERSREIGILRTIGASNKALWKIVTFEGVIIGLISWVFSSLLAYPISKILSDSIGEILFKTPLVYTFPISGILFWLIVVIIVSVLACLIPTSQATKLTIQESLSYE